MQWVPLALAPPVPEKYATPMIVSISTYLFHPMTSTTFMNISLNLRLQFCLSYESKQLASIFKDKC